MSMRTPLARAKGHGSAKEGVHHWWMQRVTAIAMVPLTLWFAFAVAGLVGADHATVSAWFQAPVNMVLAVVYLATLFYHASLGVQVIIEDYVHSEGAKFAAALAAKFVIYLAGATAILSALRISFGG